MSEIPEGWEEEVFEDIAEIASGQVDPTVQPFIDYPHVAPDNIESNTGKLSGVKTARELGLKSGKYLFDENAIVYSKIRPNLNKICIPNYVGTCSADMYPIWTKDGVDTFFLFQYMLGDIFLHNATRVSGRTGLPKINRDDLNRIKINIPPIEEQRAIADILGTWDEAIALTESLISALEVRKKGLMQKLLTGEVRFSEFDGDWEVKKIGEIADVKGGKRLPKGNNLVSENTGFPYIRVSDMTENGLLTENILYVPEDIAPEIDAYRIFKNDLYISVAGTIGLVGAIPNELDGANLTENADKFTNIIINRQYLLYVLQSQVIKREIDRVITQNAQSKLALTRIRKFEIPVPEDDEQNAIAQFLAIVDSQVDYINEYLGQLKQQKKGLMQQLLTGQVRVRV